MIEVPARWRWLFGMWFVFVILIIIITLIANELYIHFSTDDNADIGKLLNDVVVFLATTIIAVGGVTITGFIFFIESIRRLVDTNQIYADTVDDMRAHLLHAVIISFAVCVLYSIFCGFCMVTVFDTVGGDHARMVTAFALILIYIVLLIENLYLDYRVMGYKTYISRFANENKKSIFEKISKSRHYLMRVLPEEGTMLKADGVVKKGDGSPKFGQAR